MPSAYCARLSPSPVRTTGEMPRLIRIVAVVVATLAAEVGAQQSAIPTPESVLGFKVGADFKLATYDETIGYFQKLAAATNRVRLVDVGKTSTGRAWTLALISSSENL